MPDLTSRQVQILKVIIEEYMATAAPVGSEILDKKYNLGVSPATIRNEMVQLSNQGFLHQPHTSAGRAPTPMAMKFYVRQLMQEEDLSVADEAAVKGKIWDHKEKIERLLHEATRVLSERTKALALATTEDGDIYHAGYANLLESPEFFDIDVVRTVLSMIDDFSWLKKIFGSAMGEEEIHILLGDELGIQFLQPCGIIFTNYHTNRGSGTIGIVGPCRINFSRAIPNLRYITNLIQEIGRAW